MSYQISLVLPEGIGTSDRDALLREAYERFNAQDYEESIKIAALMLQQSGGKDAEAFNVMGANCIASEQWNKASALFTRAIACAATNTIDNDMKQFARYHANLGASLREENKVEESLEPALFAADSDPTEWAYLLNIASSLILLERHEEAAEWMKRALLTDPESSEAHVMFGHHLLLHGEWAAGWREEAWHTRLHSKMDKFPKLHSLVWTGFKLPDERIAVILDQGYGDAVQYARYLSDVADKCAGVVLIGPKVITDLLGRCEGVVACSSNLIDTPKHGAAVRMSYLPMLCGTHPEQVDAYVKADPARWQHFMQNELHHGHHYYVGVAWRGRPSPRNRNVPFELLAPVLREIAENSKHEGAADCSTKFVCLQQDATAEELALLPEMMVPPIHSFEDTAAYMHCMDYVVTIDTVVAHLAGAMSIPGSVMLSKMADWRWGLGATGTLSPWYDMLRLARQNKQGDWTAVLEDLKKAV